MKDHLRLLGFNVRDRITSVTGIVTSISFDLAGCVQGLISPVIDKDGKLVDAHWFDTKRLEIIGDTPVVEPATFEPVAGGQELPRFTSHPSK